MMASSNGNIFRVTGHLCEEFTGHRWIPRPHKGQWRGALMFSLIYKRLCKQWWGWWFETPSCPSWRHSDGQVRVPYIYMGPAPEGLRIANDFNSSPPRQNGSHFIDDIFKYIFMNDKFCISIRISLKFVPKGPIENNDLLLQVLASGIASGNSLAPNRRQAITWTSAGSAHRHVYAALGGDGISKVSYVSSLEVSWYPTWSYRPFSKIVHAHWIYFQN